MFARLDFPRFVVGKTYIVLETFLIMNPKKHFLLQFLVGPSVYLGPTEL